MYMANRYNNNYTVIIPVSQVLIEKHIVPIVVHYFNLKVGLVKSVLILYTSLPLMVLYISSWEQLQYVIRTWVSVIWMRATRNVFTV